MPGADKRARKATQNLGRLVVRGGEADVDLGDFVARDLARVFHLEGDGSGGLVESGGTTDVTDRGGGRRRGAGSACCVP